MSNKMPIVLEDDDGIRPAGRPDECFYCGQTTGHAHKDTCAVVTKKVKVEYTYEIEIEVPFHWTKYDIEFHRNESTWCANNSIEEIENGAGLGDCLCSAHYCEYVSDVDAPPYRRNKHGEIVP
jgi:hypothetical protein